ncbi:serine protease, S1-C subfamily, contains C-terminal PDZ domain [Caloramator quimbayensis]|uniref:Serine protease, S1-C subfamily, contains C-terminal PDZ domain n=1 Tax=Caloramator quimbayensis TaxID=1147123 RepID=A0A1T4Y6V8_9CLOT|nr:trypsin-like peptidase domain-containing protein [Caloramator quimbayensis]SKA96995.1 serine protease, S1-C subfamily, contains C-terminal PDZ domain [Caloramator quimbayensis]
MENNDFNNKRKSSILGYFFSALFGAVIGSFLLLTFGPETIFGKLKQETTQIPQVQLNTQQSQPETVSIKGNGSIKYAAAKIIPSVVGIVTTKVQTDYFLRPKTIQGVGSGVIVDKQGYIITNNHVADINSKNIRVLLSDGRETLGKTVWADPYLDLSVVKIESEDLTPAILGDSKSVSIGDEAIAVGNPLGLRFQRTVTAGIISAVNRTIQMQEGYFMEDLIQTDASINPGNSGGPLVNGNGEVVGVNTVKVSTAEGIGFAVPINILKPVIKSIEEKGYFITPTLGIKGFDREIASYYGYNIDSGVYVFDTIPNGPSDKANIREGDTIVTINGKTILSMLDLKEAIYNAGVGNTVSVGLKTPLGEKVVNVTLEKAE